MFPQNQPQPTKVSNHDQSTTNHQPTINQPSNHEPNHFFGTTHERPHRPSRHHLWMPLPALHAPPSPSPTHAQSSLRPPRKRCREGGWGSCQPATCDEMMGDGSRRGACILLVFTVNVFGSAADGFYKIDLAFRTGFGTDLWRFWGWFVQFGLPL